ncbi:MAG: EAL domain-containing protein, partial [Guyparkeria sp.]
VGAVHPLADREWAVIATQPRAAVLQPLYRTLWLLAVVAFFLLAIIAVVLTLLWRRTRESDELRWAARTAEQDRLLRVFYDMPFFGMAITSPSDHRILEANARLAEMLGHPGESLVGKSWDALLDGARHDDERQAMDDLLAGRIDHCPQEYSLKLPDGRNAYLRVDSRLIRSEDGEAERLVSIAEDVTGEREAYRALENRKDLYNLLSQTNQAITRCRSADELFETACRVAVEHGHLAFAWIGLIDEESGSVEPAHQYGDRVGYVENIEVSIHAHEPAGMGPIGRAIRADDLVVTNHFQTAASTTIWHQPAIEAGVDAVAAFPIHRDGKVIGAMALYASTSDFFDEAICRTVQELATDISFALDYFDRLEDLERAKEVVAASTAVLFRWRPTTGWPVEYVSENVERWGYRAKEWIEGRVPFIDYLHPDDVPRISEEVDTHIQHQHREFRQEYRLRMSDGRYRWFEDRTRFRFDSDGDLASITGVLTDIDDRHEIEQHDRLMAMVIENTREGVVITDRDQIILEVNPAFTELTGYTAEEMVGKSPDLLSSGMHDEGFYRRMWEALKRDGHWQGEIWNRRKNGETFPEILSISAVTDREGEITHYVGVFVDISRQKESESRLDFLAHYDPLTRLPNRPLLMTRLEQLIDIARRENGNIAVLMIDLDRFKDVNDSLGHAVGDQLLVKVSERLRERFGQADIIARMGGDEFAMAITGIESTTEVGKLADQVITAMGEPWELGEGQQVRVLASVGISLYPHNADSPIGLAQQADTALYRAKDEGRGTFRFFSDEMTDAARDRVALELQLRQAIDNDELRLVYQPQTRLNDGGLHGAEVLVRWQHPTEGLISPDRFIPVAETTGLIWPLGEWVLREACRQGQAWLDAGHEFGRVAVNLSPHQLRHGEVDRLVEQVLAETGFPADRLELELTESAIIQRESEARELLDRLRAMGVHVALDDFGTGYSSLGQLREFAIDVLKIDKGFVDLIEEPSDRGQIARVIIDLGHTLGLKVLAEGVERDSQLDFLRQYHCDIYQGFLESRPLAPEAFAQRYLEGGADGRSRS